MLYFMIKKNRKWNTDSLAIIERWSATWDTGHGKMLHTIPHTFHIPGCPKRCLRHLIWAYYFYKRSLKTDMSRTRAESFMYWKPKGGWFILGPSFDSSLFALRSTPPTSPPVKWVWWRQISTLDYSSLNFYLFWLHCIDIKYLGRNFFSQFSN
jgi:hypothetical protein